MTVNPFEPPRTTVLDSAGPVAPAELRVLPEGAIRELVASTPAVRWTGRLAAASLVASAVNGVVSLASLQQRAQVTLTVAALIVGIPLNLLFVFLYWRCANALERLTGGDERAVDDVIDGQRRLFTVFGWLIAVFIGLVIVAVVVGVIFAVIQRRPGR